MKDKPELRAFLFWVGGHQRVVRARTQVEAIRKAEKLWGSKAVPQMPLD